MSMPSFPKLETILTREQAINAIIASIALEETAIAHILEAESEKIRHVIKCAHDNGCGEADMQLVLDVNKGVADLIDKATNMQIALKEKLDIAVKHLPPHPPVPPIPPIPPCHCTSEFRVLTKGSWFEGEALRFEEVKHCKNGVKHIRKNCESRIILPGCSEYKIECELNVTNNDVCPIDVEVILEFRVGEKIVHMEKVSKYMKDYVKMAYSMNYKTLCESKEQSVMIRLSEPEKIRVDGGKLLVTEITNMKII